MRPRLLPLNRLSAVALIVSTLPTALALAGGGGVSFSAAAYVDHVKKLASDEWGGRGPGQPGIEKAADYIADVFKQAGLEPLGDDGTYFQKFDIRRGKKIVAEKAALRVEGGNQDWKVGVDWTPLAVGKSEDVEGPLAFAGYGIVSEKFEWDDYKDFDPAGKVLLILRYEPKSADAKADFGGETPSSESMFVRKAKWAAERKAKALLIVNPPSRNPDKDELIPFEGRGFVQTLELPMAQVSRAVADQLLKQAGAEDLATLTRRLDEERKPAAQDLKGLTVALGPGVEANMVTGKNVVGLLKGSGETDEVIVIGGHYDHLGSDTKSDGTTTIFNGADDNASGTAGVLELARAFGHEPRPRRSIVFMTFSGEELGLLGSAHWVKKPTIDLERVKFMLNLDMIGRYDPKKFEIYGLETSKELRPVVTRATEELDMAYHSGADLVGRSDHASFMKKKIPVLFPFTGMHPQYHKADDDWELINGEGAAKVLELAYRVAREMAELKEGPPWRGRDEDAASGDDDDDGKPAASRPARERRERAERNGDDARPAMPRVRLGIMPDMSGEGRGVRIEQVMPGGAAAAAGLKDGDRIIRIGKTDVADLGAYMSALADARPGDEVEVVVLRDDQEMTVKVKLAAPPGDDRRS